MASWILIIIGLGDDFSPLRHQSITRKNYDMNLSFRNELEQWNIDHKSNGFLQKDKFENFCEMTAILSRPQGMTTHCSYPPSECFEWFLVYCGTVQFYKYACEWYQIRFANVIELSAIYLFDMLLL